MKAVWTMAEQYDGRLKAVSFELLARGRRLADKLGAKLVSVLIGCGVSGESLQELIRRGADEVIAVQDEGLKFFVCEDYEKILEGLIVTRRPEIILAAATSSGRTLMPYTAVKVHAGLTADCTELDIEEGTGNLLQTRPAIGGNIMATIKTPDHRPQMATVRPRSSRPLEEDFSRRGTITRLGAGEVLAALDPGAAAGFGGGTVVEGCRKEESGFVNLEEAEVVISGGRGLKKGENFRIIKRLAKTLGGEAGASRDAVDRGWMSYPHQVGLSGKTVSPRLYMGVGISGAIQHLAGIKTSETIVSVNIDPEANLHKVADLAVVGDAFEVLGELQKRLDKASKRLDAASHKENTRDAE
jgi:electron transfer flavoprotein alpha subunit